MLTTQREARPMRTDVPPIQCPLGFRARVPEGLFCGRERGWRSLNESIIQQSGQEIDVRLVEISLGTRISCCVVAYFSLVAESSSNRKELRRNIHKVIAAIRNLKVEENCSVVIDMYLLAASHAEMTTRIGDAERGFDEDGEQSVHLILKEVLRLEVAFSYSDLPMMVSDDQSSQVCFCAETQKSLVYNGQAKELSLLVGDYRYWEAPDLYHQINEVIDILGQL